jgi:hypothetical protein
MAHLYQASMEIAGRAYMNRKPPAHMTKERQNAMMSAARYLAEHFAEVPVLILAWLQFTHEQENPQPGTGTYASFSAAQWQQHFPRRSEHDRCLLRSRFGVPCQRRCLLTKKRKSEESWALRPICASMLGCLSDTRWRATALARSGVCRLAT